MHKRCKANVANNCGINARQLADILNDMGMTPSKLNESAKPAKKKVEKFHLLTDLNGQFICTSCITPYKPQFHFRFCADENLENIAWNSVGVQKCICATVLRLSLIRNNSNWKLNSIENFLSLFFFIKRVFTMLIFDVNTRCFKLIS